MPKRIPVSDIRGPSHKIPSTQEVHEAAVLFVEAMVSHDAQLWGRLLAEATLKERYNTFVYEI